MTIEHQQFISKTRTYETEDYPKSLRLLLSSVALLALSYGCTLFVPFISIKLSAILHGLLIVRLFGMYHDFAHGAILRKGKIGSRILKAFGVYALAPISIWRRSHNFHNSKLASANIGSYPIMSKQEYLSASKQERTYYLLARHPLLILFGY